MGCTVRIWEGGVKFPQSDFILVLEVKSLADECFINQPTFYFHLAGRREIFHTSSESIGARGLAGHVSVRFSPLQQFPAGKKYRANTEPHWIGTSIFGTENHHSLQFVYALTQHRNIHPSHPVSQVLHSGIDRPGPKTVTANRLRLRPRPTPLPNSFSRPLHLLSIFDASSETRSVTLPRFPNTCVKCWDFRLESSESLLNICIPFLNFLNNASCSCGIFKRGLPLMTSTKISDFFTPPPGRQIHTTSLTKVAD